MGFKKNPSLRPLWCASRDHTKTIRRATGFPRKTTTNERGGSQDHAKSAVFRQAFLGFGVRGPQNITFASNGKLQTGGLAATKTTWSRAVVFWWRVETTRITPPQLFSDPGKKWFTLFGAWAGFLVGPPQKKKGATDLVALNH